MGLVLFSIIRNVILFKRDIDQVMLSLSGTEHSSHVRNEGTTDRDLGFSVLAENKV